MAVAGPCSRSVYLITYSQADIKKVESRLQFSDMVLESFRRNGTANVLRWVYCKEDHKDQGHQYHMAIKLDRQKRWLSVSKDLDQKFGVKVHFSDKHSNYYEAW